MLVASTSRPSVGQRSDDRSSEAYACHVYVTAGGGGDKSTALAKNLFATFGLDPDDGALMRRFTLFQGKVRGRLVDWVQYHADFYRGNSYIREHLARSADRPPGVWIGVRQWFIDDLREFGADFELKLDRRPAAAGIRPMSVTARPVARPSLLVPWSALE